MSESFPYDPEAPIAALKRAGVAVQRSTTTSSSSFSINGIDLGGSASSGARFVFTLPEPSPLQLVLGEEKLSQKFVKIFKKELQVGDSNFDDAVFITTSDKEIAGRFLANEEVREIAYLLVVRGGTVAVEGERVTVNIASSAAPEEGGKSVARLVCHVMAFRA